MTDFDSGAIGRTDGGARPERPDPFARVAELEAENAALRRALAEAGLGAEGAADRHGAELSRERAGRSIDAAEARSAAARAEALHGREMAAGRADLAASEGANGALRRANADLAASRAALREREERLRLILASATDYAIFTMDLDRSVTSWNEGAERLLGWREEEIVGRPADAIFTPEDRETGAPAQEAEGALREGRADDDRWHQRRDGTRFWANGLMLPLRDPEADPAAPPVGLLKVMRDETGRRRTEEALREAEDHLRHTVELNPQIPWTADPEGRIVGFSGRWLEATGLTREAAMGEGWMRVPHPEDRPRMEAAWARSVSTGEPYDVEARLRMADGSHRWWRARASPRRDTASGGIVRWYGTTEDIHDRRSAEARLAALVELGDRLRDLRDPADTAVAAGVVGRALGAARAGFGAVDAAGEVFRVERDWTDGRLGSSAGAYRLSDFWTGFADDLRRDEVVAVDDASRDPRTAGAAAAAYAAEGVGAFVNVGAVEAGRVAAILYAQDTAPRRWTAEEVGFLRGVAGRVRAAAERARAEAALRESEGRLQATQDHAGVGIVEIDARGRYARVNGTYTRMTGWAADDLVGRAYWDLIEDGGDRRDARRDFGRLARGEAERLAAEREYTDRHGRRWWAEITAAAIRGAPDAAHPRGRFLYAVRTVQDVTERKRAEERRALLVNEVNHRAKNALAVVQAMLRLTEAADVPAFVRSVEGRIAALGRAHTLLADRQWSGTSLHDLVRGELAPFIAGRATVDGPAVTLPAVAAQPVAMAVHELATNAAKHGALSVPAGSVAVTWRIDGARLRIRWAESGGPPVAGPPERRGFGTRLLEATLRQQLQGSVEKTWAESGLLCDVVVPLGEAKGGH